jgi:hypothetical protein
MSPWLPFAFALFLPAAAAAAQNQNQQNQDPPPTPGGQVPYSPREGQPSVPPPQPPPQPSAQAQPQAPPSTAPGAGPAHPAAPAGTQTEPDEWQPRVRLDFAVGSGNWRHSTQNAPTLDDDTNAGYVRLGVEFLGQDNLGGGFRIEGIGSDDDLFRDSGGPPSEARDLDLFMHFTGLFGEDRFHMPVRLGLFLRDYYLEDKTTGGAIEWFSIGPRIEAEPDFALVICEQTRWSVFARVGFGFGATAIYTDPATEDFTTTMTMADVGIGTRLSIGHVQFEAALLDRAVRYDESDVVNGSFVRRVDTEFQGLVIGGAVIF